MKYLLFLSFCTLFLFSCSDDDTDETLKTMEGDVSLRTQEDIDHFGAEGYQKITGILSIVEETDDYPIIDLSPLENLQSVMTLYVQKTSKLVDLHGLNNLRSSKNGGIVITENQSLTSLKGLNSLSEIDNIILIDNPKLEDISLLKRIKNELDMLYISGNALKNLEGVNNIKTVKQDIDISQNLQLTSLKGLENIRLTQILRIYQNPELEDFCALKGLLKEGTIETKLSIGMNKKNPKVDEIINEDCD